MPSQGITCASVGLCHQARVRQQRSLVCLSEGVISQGYMTPQIFLHLLITRRIDHIKKPRKKAYQPRVLPRAAARLTYIHTNITMTSPRSPIYRKNRMINLHCANSEWKHNLRN